MAAKKPARKPTNKSSKPKKPVTVRRPSASAKPVPKSGMNPQIKAILLCAVSAVFFALLFIKGDNAWLAIRNFMFGVFGFCFLLIPFIFLYMGILTAKEKQMSHKGAKVALSIGIVLFSCTVIYLCGETDYNAGRGYFSALKDVYLGAFNHSNFSGLFGALIGYPMRLWFTNAPAVILSIVVLIVFIMLLTGITLVDVANVAKKQYNRYNERKEQRRERRRVSEEEFDDAPADTDTSYINREHEHNKKRSGRIDIPIDNSKSKKSPFTMPEDPSDKRDLEIIDIIKNANNGIVSDEQTDASTVAQRISKKKSALNISDGAKQPDPETVPVDLEHETSEIEHEINKAKTEEKPSYSFPSVKLLDPSIDSESTSAMLELQSNATKLVDTLESFGVKASITNICRGPSVTRYELQPAAGVKISKITNLSDDIALNLAADGVRIEAPIPGKAAVGIEVPNKVVSTVSLRELIDSDEFRSKKSKLSSVLGKDISGNIVVADLAKMPHLLIAGTTGSGKSVCVNSILMSVLYKADPEQVKFLLIDPKMVEFSKYKGIPHLLVPVVSDAKKAAGALNWAVSEMLNRYKLFAEYDCKDIDTYNTLIEKNINYIAENTPPDSEEDVCMEVEGLPVGKEKLPRIVIAIDELADLMMAAPSEVEDAICRLAQMARAAGMHLIIATQRPSVNVITGVIKANIPSRIALKVSSNVDSRTILDFGGAEKLIGKGDMLFSPVGVSKPIRVQGCFARDEEIERVTSYIKKAHNAQYNQEIEEKIRKIAAEEINSGKSKDNTSAQSENSDNDEMIEEAIKAVIEAGQASTSFLQRRLKVGYARAGRMVDQMEQMGIVGPYQGSKARDVLMTYNDWLERNNLLGDYPADSGDTDE